MKDIIIVVLLFVAAAGWHTANNMRKAEPPITNRAQIECPVPSTFSIVRDATGYVTVICNGE